ncbi:alpha-hydroxy acid oxidase [Xaviernesmea oryzae]|nr:alpha-hydroxy acid oxidase [Xaviernesmea oryzae]
MAKAAKAITIDDLQRMAMRRLPKFIGDYIETGAGDGGTATRNINAFRQFKFVPRSLVKVTPVDTSVTLFDQTYAAPFGISAVGMTSIYRRGADWILAEVAREANIPFILSGAASAPLEEIIRIAPDHTWFQMYVSKLDQVNLDVIRRGRQAGVKVLVVTVDYPIPNVSQVAARTGISMASGPTVRTFPKLAVDALRHPVWTAEFLRSGGMPLLGSWARYAPSGSRQKEISQYYIQNWCRNIDWHDLEAVRREWPGRLVIKGVVHPQDVSRALSLGADAVTISNHGGNKLDTMQASIDSLISNIDDEQPEKPLFLDGGIRRGSDIAISLALGAKFCFFGRPTLYGVTAGGKPGAQRAVEILKSELAYTMAMIGAPDVSSIRRAKVTR